MRKNLVRIVSMIIVLSGVATIEIDAAEITSIVEKNESNEKYINYAKGVGKSNPTDVVYIPDSNLKSLINDELGHDSGDEVTVADMESIGMLYNNLLGSGEEVKIKDITGLEYATNLSTLNLVGNLIDSVEPLSDLTNLVSLNLSNNKITDISSLDKLANVTTVNLSNNEINNIGSISSWNNIDDLNLSNNQLTDINELNNISTLRILNIEHNQISEIPVFTNGTRLQALKMSDNEINSLESIKNSNVPMLSCVRVEENHISDLRPLDSLMSATMCPPDGARIIGQNQTIYLDKIEVNENQNISYNVYNRDGVINEVELTSSLEPGLNELSGNWSMDFDTMAPSDFSGIVYQEVFYNVLSADSQITINEENPLTDEKLLDMFKVKSAASNPITVDQSAINYSVPGKYKVKFEQKDNKGMVIGEQTSTLVVNDVLPVISSNTNELSIELGETPDVIKDFGLSATEINNGDLTDQILVNDSSVLYDETGQYPIEVQVTDEENNTVNKTIILNIVRNVTKPVDPVTPEIGTLPEIKGIKDITINLGEKIDLLNGITAFDAEDGNLTAKLQLDDATVDYNKTGEYEVVYSVMDSDGNMVEEIITLTIKRNLISPVDPITPEVDPEKPEVVDPEKPEEVDPEKPEVVDPEKPEVVDPEKPEVVNPVNPTVPVNPLDPDKPEVVDPEKPEVVDPEKPEVVDPEKPEVVDPEKPEVVDPEKPEVVEPEKPEAVDPEKPEVVDPEKPEVVDEAKTKDENKKLEDTGIKFSLSIFLIIIASLAIGVKVRKKYN